VLKDYLEALSMSLFNMILISQCVILTTNCCCGAEHRLVHGKRVGSVLTIVCVRFFSGKEDPCQFKAETIRYDFRYSILGTTWKWKPI